MNELEINKAVAEKLGYQFQIGSQEDDTETGVYLVHQGVVCLEFNPTRDAQDAWPIIEKYKIDLKHRDGAWYACFSDEDHLVITDDESALKAAMLCFLEMEI